MEERTAEYLWKASRLVSTRPVLHCHYLSKCRSLVQEGEVGHLPAKAFRKSEVCNFCNNVWLYGRCHVSVLPKKLPGRKMKKIIHKQELAQTLRPFEKKLFEKYKKEKDNKLVLKCSVCQKRTVLPLSKPVKLKPTEIQNDNVETPVKSKKKKKKKKKDAYAGLNSSIISVYTPKRELSHMRKELGIKKENEPSGVVSSSMQPSVTPQEDQSQSRRRRKRNARQNSNDLALFNIARQKMHNVKSVREQIAQAKQQIRASEKKNKEKFALELENAAKKARKCNALRNILADSSASSRTTKPTLKEFLASVN